MTTHSSRWIVALALVATTLLAFGLRTDGLDWSLPYRLHPDEWKYVSGGAGVHAGQWNPQYFRNPPGFSYMNAAWFPFWLFICPDVPVPEVWQFSPSTDVIQTLQTRPYDLVYGARALSALCGVGVLWLTVAIAWHLFGGRTALLAAVLLAVSFVSVRESHMGTNDTASVFWLLAAFLAGVRARSCISLWPWLLAGVLGGMAIATKYNTVPVVPALMALVFVSPHRSMQKRLAVWGLTGGGALVGFLVVCPFPVLDPQTFWSEIARLSEAANRGWPGQDTTFSGLQLLNAIVLSEGWIASVSALLGSGFLLRERRWEVFVFPLLYALLVMMHPLFFVRFALPVLPFVVILAAVGMSRGVEALLAGRGARLLSSSSSEEDPGGAPDDRDASKPTGSVGENDVRSAQSMAPAVASILILGLAVIQPLALTLRSNWLFGQTDTRIESLYWLWEQQAEDALAVGDQYVIPIPYRTGVPPWGVPMDPRFQVIDALPASSFDRMENTVPPVRYVGVSSFASFPGQHDEPYVDRRHALKRFARAEEPLVRFSPFTGDQPPQAAHIEDTYHPTTRLWERDQPGPVVEWFYRDVESS